MARMSGVEDPKSASPEPAGGPAGPGRRPAAGSRAWRELAVATVVFALAAAWVMGDLAGRDPTRFAIANVSEQPTEGPRREAWHTLGLNDLRFVTWQIARNARVLPTRPWRFFDAGMCHPAENAMAFGPSAFTLGVLGMPAWWWSRDPVLSWNWTLFAVTLAAALGMFLLVREWTGMASAGIAAGVLYAFHEAKLGDAIHLYVWDNAWTAFALYFATRWLRDGRWRDALGLGLATVLQMGGSLYPLVAAAVIGLPYAAHQLWRRRLVAPPLAQWLALGAGVAVFALLLFSPYFGARDTGALQATEYQFFRPFEWLLPGAGGSPGLVMAVGLGAALLLPARLRLAPRRVREPDPRWVLLGAAVVIVALSVVPGEGTTAPVVGLARDDPRFNLYIALARIVPGLEVGRSPGAVYTGAHLLWCALAGLGIAGLLRGLPKGPAPWAAVGVVALALVDTLRPPALGLTPRYRHRAVELRPPDELLAFFDAALPRGGGGAVLELPLVQLNFDRASLSVLLSAYHRHPTAHCYNSFYPEVTRHVEELAGRLPEREALAELAGLGFSTLVVHHPPGEAFLAARHERFRAFERGPAGAMLERLHSTDEHTAYRIVADGA